MNGLEQIAGNRVLDVWGNTLPRHPAQLNGIHCADAELIPIAPGITLALTIDSVVEEILCGLYDAATAGWVAVTASLSDLAATGAEPVALTVSVTLPANDDGTVQREVARGIRAACDATGTYVAGGDTNTGTALSISAHAAGIVRNNRHMTRLGCVTGDLLYTTAPLGAGLIHAATLVPSFATAIASDYRPLPRLKEGWMIAGFATSCMDTSDGFIATVDQLSRVNNVGFDINCEPAQLLNETVRGFCEKHGLDPLIALAQQHGEFELLFTAPASVNVRALDWPNGTPICIGRVVPDLGVRIGTEHRSEIDCAAMRNAADAGSPEAVLAQLRILASLTREF